MIPSFPFSRLSRKALHAVLITALLCQQTLPIIGEVTAAGSATISGTDGASLFLVNSGAGDATSGPAPVDLSATCDLSSAYPAASRFPGSSTLYLKISCNGSFQSTAFTPNTSASVSTSCNFPSPGTQQISCWVNDTNGQGEFSPGPPILVSASVTVTGAPACGTATSTSYSPSQSWSNPDSRLCAPGTQSSPVYDASSRTWSWSCSAGGYPTASCQSQPGVICGSADGVTTATPPSSNLCGVGSASTVSLAGNTYSWSCSGPNSDVVSCSAPQEINGICGSANGTPTYSTPSSNLCSAGTASSMTDTGNGYTWSCDSTTGGSNASCSTVKRVDGVCGSATTQTYDTTTGPTSNLCSIGSASSVSTNGASYIWSCSGQNTGVNANCSADMLRCDGISLSPSASGSAPYDVDVSCLGSHTTSYSIDCGNGSPAILSQSGSCHYDFDISDSTKTKAFSPSCTVGNGSLSEGGSQCTTQATINRPSSCNNLALTETVSQSGTLITNVSCSTSYADTVAIDCGNGEPLINGATGSCTYDIRSDMSVTAGSPKTFTPKCLVDGVASSVPACTESIAVSQQFDLRLKKYVNSIEGDAQDSTGAVSVNPNNRFDYLIQVSNAGIAPTRNTTTVHDILPEGVYLLDTPTGTGWSCTSTLPTPVASGSCIPEMSGTGCLTDTGVSLNREFSCTSTDIVTANTLYPDIHIPVFTALQDLFLTNTGEVSNPDEYPSLSLANDPLNRDPAVIHSLPFDLQVKKYIVRSESDMQAYDAQDENSAVIFYPESTFFYRIDVKNMGSGSAQNDVIIRDTLPLGISQSGTIRENGWNCGGSGTGNIECRYQLGRMPAGNSYPTILIPVAVTTRTPSIITNTVEVDHPNEYAPRNLANDPFNRDPAVIRLELPLGPGGGMSSLPSAPSTPVPPVVVATSSPSTHTTAVAPEKVIKEIQSIVIPLIPELLFVLPKKLLLTGTPIIQKGMQIFKNAAVETSPMYPSDQYGFSDISTAPQDYKYWKSRIQTEDKTRGSIIVIPSIGIVAPINEMNWSGYPTGASDFAKVKDGQVVSPDPYLHNGVLHYPLSAYPGEVGNTVIAGHSSYYKKAWGRYKTIFGNIMELDPTEEVWIFSRDAQTGNVTLYRYRVTQSYNAHPGDVEVLLPGTGKSLLTIFTCTPIGGVAGRWIIRAELIHSDGQSCSMTTEGGGKVSGSWKGEQCVRTSSH